MVGAMSTPHAAYLWCRAAGLSHDQALAMTRSRGTFEFFVEALG